MPRIQHLLFKLEAFVASCDSGEIARRRVALGAAAGSVEIFFAGLQITGLEVGDIHALAPATAILLGDLLLCMDKRSQRCNLIVGTVEGWHPFIRTPGTNDRADFVSTDVRAHQ